MGFIEPLAMETIIINLFSGNYILFTVIALIVVFALCAFFRMTLLATFFMVGLFLLMFQDKVSEPLLFIALAIAGLLIGSIVSRIVKN